MSSTIKTDQDTNINKIYDYSTVVNYHHEQISKTQKRHTVKEALDNLSLIPYFFPQKVEIFIPSEVYTYVIDACSFLLATSIQLQKYKDFSLAAILKSRLQ